MNKSKFVIVEVGAPTVMFYHSITCKVPQDPPVWLMVMVT